MAEIKQGRWTAEIEGDFVVFIIGARINSKWQAFKSLTDLGGRKGMNHMLKYLMQHPEKALLGYQMMGFANVQYWRSFEHLEGSPKTRNVPPRGLGKAGRLVPVAESVGAPQRLKAATKRNG